MGLQAMQKKKKKKNPQAEGKDHVYIYSCALIYEGLKDLATRDFVRENDGPGILPNWWLLIPTHNCKSWTEKDITYSVERYKQKLILDYFNFECNPNDHFLKKDHSI